ncbi:MAG: CinA family nicotinamide mononucleotide deamidase-related protein [Polyangiaceae bacterium]
MATACVLCIGTELTRGEVVNSNGSSLGEWLTAAGFEVAAIETVDDDAARIIACLKRLSGEHSVLVATGGLGPTTDDITTACVATYAGVPLLRDADSLAAIRARFEKLGRTMAPSNEKQADFPRGARVLPNPNGTAPGFSLQLGKALCFFMPGVPREMGPMFQNSVLPAIAHLVDESFHQVRLRSFGLPESEVNDRSAGVEAEFGVLVGYRASFPTIEVKLLARAADATTAATKARAAADEVRRRLGDEVVFGEGDVTFAQALGRDLAARKLKLAAAESCTGGLVGQLLTARGGSSEYFVGSAVTYANSAKIKLLGVPDGLLAAHGAVSAEVAVAMAEGARALFGVDVALAITGIAGPDGGSEQKPVGLVHFAVATPRGTHERHFVYPGDRDMIRLRAAYAALGLVRQRVRAGDCDS